MIAEITAGFAAPGPTWKSPLLSIKRTAEDDTRSMKENGSMNSCEKVIEKTITTKENASEKIDGRQSIITDEVSSEKIITKKMMKNNGGSEKE